MRQNSLHFDVSVPEELQNKLITLDAIKKGWLEQLGFNCFKFFS